MCRTAAGPWVKSEKDGAYGEIREKAAAFSQETGYKVSCKGAGKALEILTFGVSAHGAKPEDGLNAISVMMEFLGRLNFANEDQKDFIRFYNEAIGFHLDGAGLHADLADEPSGKLVFNVGMIELNGEAAKLTINIRYPVTATEEAVFAPMEEMLNQYDIGLIKTEHRPSDLSGSGESSGRNAAGDLPEADRRPGSKTAGNRRRHVCRCTPGIVAYGAQFPGDTRYLRVKNEFLEISRLTLMTKIYAEAIYKLSQGGYNM